MNAATVRSYGSFVAAMATPDLVNLIAAAAEELAKRGPLDEEKKNDDAKRRIRRRRLLHGRRL